MARQFLHAGGMYVHHRYCSVEERLQFSDELHALSGADPEVWTGCPIFGCSIGLNETEDEIRRLAGKYDLLSIDVAAAYSQAVIDRISDVATILAEDSTTLLMVGNYSSPQFVLQLWNDRLLHRIDLLKVSQGGGSVCSTRINIGVGVPTLQAVMDSADLLERLKLDGFPPESLPLIVADGGIKTTGDMVKAYGAGASIVMCGGMFSAFSECPGEIHHIDGVGYKAFRGMASRAEKYNGNKALSHIEGVSSLVPMKGSVGPYLQRVRENIQSGIATTGHNSLQEFIGGGEFVRVTPNGTREGTPHVKGKISEH